jgi:hypothetical protein
LSSDGRVDEAEASASAETTPALREGGATDRLEEEIERLHARLSDLQARVEGMPSR